MSVSSFRPFYVLGEVEKPGEYPYRTGLNILSAIAMAGGDTYRANQSHALVQHAGESSFQLYPLSPSVPIEPGDLIKLPERYFERQDAGSARGADAVRRRGAFYRRRRRRRPNLTPWPNAAGVEQPSYLTPTPLSRDNPLTRRTPDYSGLTVSDWLFNPNLLIGGVYNDNLLQTQTGRTGAAGVRVQGDVVGVRDAGLSRTAVFADVDAYIYPDRLRDNSYDGRVGVSQIWELQPSLAVKAQIEADQGTYPTFGGQVVAPGGAVASLTAPQRYRQLQSSIAVQKSSGRYFLGASLAETATGYDALATTVGSLSQAYRDSLRTTLTQRGGYWISRMVYAFGETSENWRRYVDDPLASQGYRAVAGLGSDRIGLFRGEVYGGYQEQSYTAARLGAARTPVFGGKLYWYLSRAWTLSGSVDETFSDANNATPSNPQGDPARVTASQIKLNIN